MLAAGEKYKTTTLRASQLVTGSVSNARKNAGWPALARKRINPYFPAYVVNPFTSMKLQF